MFINYVANIKKHKNKLLRLRYLQRVPLWRSHNTLPTYQLVFLPPSRIAVFRFQRYDWWWNNKQCFKLADYQVALPSASKCHEGLVYLYSYFHSSLSIKILRCLAGFLAAVWCDDNDFCNAPQNTACIFRTAFGVTCIGNGKHTANLVSDNFGIVKPYSQESNGSLRDREQIHIR